MRKKIRCVYTSKKYDMINQEQSKLLWRSEKFHRFVINNLYKLFLLFFGFIGIIIMVDETIIIKNIASYILLIIAIGIVIDRFHRKVVYEIEIYPEIKEISLKVYRSHENIKLRFDEIDQIRINGYASILFNQRKLFIGVKIDKELLDILSKIRQIKWGAFCFIFGPSKNLRSNY